MQPWPVRIGSPWLADLAALAAGLALPLAFAPFALWPIAPLCVAVVFLAWLQATPRRALWRGWLFGVGAFGAGVSWIHESFQYNHIDLPVAIALTGAFVASMALYPGVAGLCLARLARCSEVCRLLLVYPAVWMLFEWLRGWLFTGFPWLLLGHSQLDGPLAGLFPVLGVHGVSWAAALVGGGVALAARRRGRTAPVWLAVVILPWVIGALVGRVPWTAPSGPPLTVALVQGNVSQADKWRPEMRAPTLERYRRLSRRGVPARLVIWPETALPGYAHSFEAFVRDLGAEARARGGYVLFGVPVYDAVRRRPFNSVVLVGASDGVYHKRHLVPFGEYLPWRRWLVPMAESLGIAAADFAPGPAKQAPMRIDGHRMAVSVCYEIAFGSEIRLALPDAAFLVTLSNDAWFGRSIGPHQHFEIARARARETGRYLLRATNTGVTAIVDDVGEVATRLEQFVTGVLDGEVVPMGGSTPYVRFGDVPLVVAALVLVAAPLVWRAIRRPAPSRAPERRR